MFLPLSDGAEPFAVDRVALGAARGAERVALEVGLDATASLDEIAGAIGLPSDAHVADVRARLRARRQDELQSSLPEGDGRDDDVLDELMGLGG